MKPRFQPETRKNLNVTHFAILSNHIHLLMEPGDAQRLARSIQSLAISFAKRLNQATQKQGAVFADRYHLRTLRTPTEVRRALTYVLSNDAKHAGLKIGTHFISPLNSGFAFDGWSKLFDGKHSYRIATDWSIGAMERWLAEILTPPRSWLLREGWRRGRVSQS